MDTVNFKIYTLLQESEFVKKSVCYYIDLTNNKAYVIEMRYENDLIGQNEYKDNIQREVDIDSAENVFHEDYFMSIF